jgi:hypothetical protein
MPCYFFSGSHYIRVTRAYTGPGTVDAGYPKPIADWGWGNFGKNGIDAALYSGPVDYFFSGNQYIRVHRGNTGPGTVDAGYPKNISEWGWGSFGQHGISAALWSDTACYFFSGNQYIRVRRADEGAGTVDSGYPMPISEWGWGQFGKNGIDAALNSGPVDYFFSGEQYIRVRRGDIGPGSVDPGYPAPISNWGWKEFGVHGIRPALFSGFDFTNPASLPADLASNSNYVMSASGSDLTGVTITVDFTNDMVVKSNGPPLPHLGSVSGFTLQLNCYSPGKDVDAWQQYVIGFDGSNLYGQINNWRASSVTTPLINQIYGLTSVSGNKVPIFYKLRIGLLNDAHHNVTGVTFEVRDDNGQVVGSHTQTLIDIGGVSSSDIAPMVAYQVVLVGPGNGESATLSSGAGTILHQCQQAIAPGSGEPSDSEVTWGTAETANSTYARLSATPGIYFAQGFGVDTSGSAKMRAAPGDKMLPPLPGRVRERIA